MLRELHATLLAAAILWCVAVLAAPLLAVRPVYEFFAAICHQDPARSWWLFGEPLPVCIRCASMSFGFLAAVLIQSPCNLRWLRFASALIMAEFVLARILMDSTAIRCLSGVAIGFAAAPFVRRGIEEMWSKRRVSV